MQSLFPHVAAQGIMICFSIINSRSFEEATVFRDTVHIVAQRRQVDPQPILLVGCKRDLEDKREVLFIFAWVWLAPDGWALGFNGGGPDPGQSVGRALHWN